MSADQRRADLLVAAGRVAAADGIGAVTMERVATEAGVSIGLVYVHFPGRDAVVQALAESELAVVDESMRRATFESWSLEDRLRSVLAAWLGCLAGRGRLADRLVAAAEVDTWLAESVASFGPRGRQTWQGALEALLGFDSGTAAAGAAAVDQLVVAAGRHWLAAGGDVAVVVDQFTRMGMAAVQELQASAPVRRARRRG